MRDSIYMTIIESYIGKNEIKYVFEYHDADSFENLDSSKVTQVYGVCFCEGQLLIGFGGHKHDWGLVGGTIEKGETYEQTLKREIREESNMEVLSYKPIGYQKSTNTSDGTYVYQLRYACTVKPFGPFVSDPDGGITEIKLIDPKEYTKYFNWGKIGERLTERAVELLTIT